MTSLHTERLELRPFTLDDAAAYWPLVSDPDVLRHTGEAPLASLADVRELLSSRPLRDYDVNGYGRLACVASWPLIAADGTSKWSWSLQVWDVAAPTCVSSTPFDFPVRLCCGTADGELVVYNESVVMLFACAWERRCAAVMGWAARCAGVWA